MKKKLFYFILFSTFFLASKIDKIYATSNYENDLKDFLANYPTIFYTNDEKQELIGILSLNSMYSSFPDSVDFIDLDDDKIYEVIINNRLNEGMRADIYKYIEDEFSFVFLDSIDGFYNFYKNSQNETTLFEGSENFSDGIKYSNVYFIDGKFYKDLLYLDDDNDFNRLSDKIYDKNQFIKNNKLIDPNIKKIEPVSLPTIFNTAKEEIRKNIDLKNIFILLNGQKLVPHTKPVINNDRILVPLRTISKAFDKEDKLKWDDLSKTVVYKDDTIDLKLVINNNEAILNDKVITLDTPPIIIDNYTMLPMRFIIETLGGQVAWTNNTRTVFMDYIFANNFKPDLRFRLQGTYYDKIIAKNFVKTYSFSEQENTENLMFWSNDTITNVQVIQIDYFNSSFADKEILFTLEKLNPGELFILDTMVPEGYPNIKIKYTDKLGTKKSVLLGYDGRLGGLNLINLLEK